MTRIREEDCTGTVQKKIDQCQLQCYLGQLGLVKPKNRPGRDI